MTERDESRASLADPSSVLGRVAVLLVESPSLSPALDALADGLRLGGAAVRTASGSLLAGRVTPGLPVVELPLHGRSGVAVGTLTVNGARPEQLPVLRSAAAVFGLALAPSADDREQDLDALADSLHDGPVQTLVVARYAADAAVRGGDVAFARDAVQAALVDVRRFLWHLRPRGAAGLVEALDQLSGNLVEAGGPALGLVGDVETAALLRGEASVLAYRLVQAVAKADGPAVRVTLRTEGPWLVVDVEGGVPLPSPDRWSRRAQALGGQLTISTGRVRLAVPHPEVRISP